MQVRFVHIRSRDKEGKLLPNGGFTVAYEVVGSETGSFIKYAVAKCSKRDTYNRKRGRLIAGGRLHADRHPFLTSVGSDERPIDAVVKAVHYESGGLRLLPR